MKRYFLSRVLDYHTKKGSIPESDSGTLDCVAFHASVTDSSKSVDSDKPKSGSAGSERLALYCPIRPSCRNVACKHNHLRFNNAKTNRQMLPNPVFLLMLVRSIIIIIDAIEYVK